MNKNSDAVQKLAGEDSAATQIFPNISNCLKRVELGSTY